MNKIIVEHGEKKRLAKFSSGVAMTQEETTYLYKVATR